VISIHVLTASKFIPGTVNKIYYKARNVEVRWESGQRGRMFRSAKCLSLCTTDLIWWKRNLTRQNLFRAN